MSGMKTQQFRVGVGEFRLINRVSLPTHSLLAKVRLSLFSLQPEGLLSSSTSCFIAFSASSSQEVNAASPGAGPSSRNTPG